METEQNLKCEHVLCLGPENCLLKAYFTERSEQDPSEPAQAVDNLGDGCPIIGDILFEFSDVLSQARLHQDTKNQS